MLVRYGSEAKVSDRDLIAVDPRKLLLSENLMRFIIFISHVHAYIIRLFPLVRILLRKPDIKWHKLRL